MFGYILATLLGYGVGRFATSSSGAVLKPASASQWSGLVGAQPFKVWRNGPTWAWQAAKGSGADATVTGALSSAVRFIIEDGSVANLDDVDLRRDDGAVRAVVVQAPGSSSWNAIVTVRGVERYKHLSPSRGAALVDLFARLKPFAEAD